jgi:sn-glycerol 3-phosphate transport system ATP-binding protein
MSEVTLEGIHKNFGALEVLRDITLHIPDGSFTVLLGPSGCGKSTLLRVIAGLEKASRGRVVIGGEDLTRAAPGDRDVAMVFQNYALYPHLTVYQNIEYGLKARKVKKAEREVLVEQALAMTRLQDQAKKLPAQMSGGQRQRAALARAIVKRPRIFLMDEPLSNLDAKLRGEMRLELIELYHKLRTTFLYVTHDQVEAMSMGTNVVILDQGLVRQQGIPRDIYEKPDNIFVAGFIGSPPANLIKAGAYTFGIRPEHISLRRIQDGMISLPGEIFSSEHLGCETIYSVRTDFGILTMRTENLWNSERREVQLYFPRDKIMAFDRTGGQVKSGSVREEALSILEKNIAAMDEGENLIIA